MDSESLKPMENSESLTEKELSKRWNLPGGTLRWWRHMQRGPSFVKVRRRVTYKLTDIVDFEKDNPSMIQANISENIA